ncbi:MAG: hypothetical protein M3391_06380, partial [Actinomycetota bacterium]|nr:hypothetical protein [Actinomycetota bacterium]
VAAHCPVRGRAHGELVRSIAHDKEATVASAEQACADAMAADAQLGSKAKPGKKDKNAKKGHPSGYAESAGPPRSKAPKAPKPAAPKAIPAAPGGAAPGNSAGHGKGIGKSK